MLLKKAVSAQTDRQTESPNKERQTSRQTALTERQADSSNRQTDQIYRQTARTDRQLEQTDRQTALMKRQTDSCNRQTNRSNRQTDRQIALTDRQTALIDRQTDSSNRQTDSSNIRTDGRTGGREKTRDRQRRTGKTRRSPATVSAQRSVFTVSSRPSEPEPGGEAGRQPATVQRTGTHRERCSGSNPGVGYTLEQSAWSDKCA